MKKILAIAAAAALTTGVSAYAANPFSDVSTSDWAYQAVADLSDQGVVIGYPDGTFRGERNITRYELAQIVARMMAREDQLNAEQRATLEKLANEYADELANLGVRVSKLEKKVGNLYWSGDARMQYQHNLDILGGLTDDKKNIMKDHKDTWNGRIRINADAEVNDKVTVSGRFVSEFDFQDGAGANTEMDRIHVRYAPNEAAYIDLGRQGVALDQTGVFWDEDARFDGVVAGYDNGKLGLEFGYGRFQDAFVYNLGELDPELDISAAEAWYGKVSANAGPVGLSGFYLENKADFVVDGDPVRNTKVWGVGANFGLGPVTVDGDYVETRVKWNGENEKAKLWTAGVTFGEVDLEKPGSFSIGAHYVNAKEGSLVFGASALDLTDHLLFAMDTDVTFWQAKAGIALQKNLELDAYYSFAADAKGAKEDPADVWGIELNYAF